MRKSKGETIFQFFNVIFMIMLISTIVFPVLNVLSMSISSRDAIISKSVTFYPKGFELGAYKEILGNSLFVRSLINNVALTIIGTLFAVIVTLMVSYSLTKEFVGKKLVTYYFIISMYFSGGLIPTYIILTSYLHLRNTYLVLLLPGLVSVFYIIVMRSQIEAMPQSVFEAAYIDGANEFQTVFQIVLPMIAPTIAAVGMFFALGFWNMWFNVMVYTDKQEYWTLQYFLRVVVFDKFLNVATPVGSVEIESAIPEENFRMAAIVMTAAPIVAIYPFVQKYFVKGIISGAVKG